MNDHGPAIKAINNKIKNEEFSLRDGIHHRDRLLSELTEAQNKIKAHTDMIEVLTLSRVLLEDSEAV